jgi:hypothetical protein
MLFRRLMPRLAGVFGRIDNRQRPYQFFVIVNQRRAPCLGEDQLGNVSQEMTAGSFTNQARRKQRQKPTFSV